MEKTILCALLLGLLPCVAAAGPVRLSFGLPGLVGPLHAGFMSIPDVADWDGDGGQDLVVYARGQGGGIFLFREDHRANGLPVYAPAERLAVPYSNPKVVDWNLDGRLDLLTCTDGRAFFHRNIGDGEPRFAEPVELRAAGGEPLVPDLHEVCQLECVWAGDRWDLLVGSMDRTEYWPRRPEVSADLPPHLGDKLPTTSWENPYDERGRWRGGPLRGRVYRYRNLGAPSEPALGPREMLMVGEQPLEVYGDAAPMAVDWNGDGVWDLLVGDFVDTITCFRNLGTADAPRFARGVPARTPDGVLHLPQNMHKTRAVDLDRDGKLDLLSGSEDGFITWCRGLGLRKGVPTFAPPVRLQQMDPPLAVGVLAVPAAADWDGDGDLDLICGNAAGYLEFVENVGTTREPPRSGTLKGPSGGPEGRFAFPSRLEAGGKVVRVQAGYRGSLQGPSESKWGYTAPAVVDWDGDGLPDLIHSDITGEHLWYRNIGTRTRPRLAAPQPIRVAGKPLRTVWRTRPLPVDWNGDGLADYICLDEKGILTYYERAKVRGRLVLREGRPFRFPDGAPVKLDGEAGLSGRANLAGGDWFGRGRIDICFSPYNAMGPGAVESAMIYVMESLDPANLVMGHPRVVRLRGPSGHPEAGPSGSPKGDGTPIKQAGSYPSPEIADWDGDGRPDLLLGCEDGSIWFYPRGALE